jgi:hypothetical protein
MLARQLKIEESDAVFDPMNRANLDFKIRAT